MTSMERSKLQTLERQLQNQKQPLSPTYMSYIYKVPEPIVREGTQDALQPTTNQSWAAIHLEGAKANHEHFHAPHNDHNKFLSEAKPADRAAYRDLPRMAPPPFDRSGRSSIRPQSAGPSLRTTQSAPYPLRPRSSVSPSPDLHTRRSTHIPGDTFIEREVDVDALMDRNMTVTGAPCYTESALVEADLELGAPVFDANQVGEDTWRLARVRVYDVPPSSVGYGSGGRRPFHQDYSHYKYFGFGGKGAKTSWGYNPKQSERWRPTQSVLKSGTGGDKASIVPRPPGQPLTVTEAKMIKMFPEHSYNYTKPVEVLEPYMESVSLTTRQPLSRGQKADKALRREQAKVATYRQPVPGELTLAENPSPNHGSQSPFHQRYAHYRLHGFAGQGATSSWARNPKLALLYDP